MRQIIVADSLEWLKNYNKTLPNVITGICDLDETNMKMDDYLVFFKNIATLIFKKLDKNGYAIFTQTDRKYNKEWIDKSAILTNIALNLGLKMVWHKIILNRGVNKTDLFRPTYSHILCYTYNGTSGAATADVLDISERLYKNATPIKAAELCLEFVKKYNKKSTDIIDPFVGYGTIVALANKMKMNAIGIDIDPKQAKKAELLKID
jgi:DNA modification methylase